MHTAQTRATILFYLPCSIGAGLGDREQLAPLAMAYGHREALDMVFRLLPKAPEWMLDDLREAIERHTSARGSDEELLRWFEERKSLLRWDGKRKKWVASKTF